MVAIIQTSYFGRAKNMANAVAISQGVPKWFTGERYMALAPPWSLVHEKNEAIYTRRYQEEVLAKLCPLHVEGDLDGKILLCWEKPDEFCHRHIVAKWLERNLLIKVQELDSGRGPEKKKLGMRDLSSFL